MEVSFVSHSRILSILETELPPAVFPAYVCGTAPDGVSLAATRGSEVLAGVLDGARFGLFEACGPWLFSRNDEATLRLLDELAQTGIPHGLEFAPEHMELVRSRFPAAVLSEDVLLALDPRTPTHSASANGGSLVQLVSDDARWAMLTPSLRRSLGSLDAFSAESPLWGWQQGDAIISMCETLVRFGRFACFGQVVTDPDHRGQGNAKRLVSKVSAFLREQGFTPLWLASAANDASIRLAGHVGFRECARFGCVEYGDIQEGVADIE